MNPERIRRRGAEQHARTQAGELHRFIAKSRRQDGEIARLRDVLERISRNAGDPFTRNAAKAALKEA